MIAYDAYFDYIPKDTVDEIFALTLPKALEYLDFKVYVEVPDILRMNRKINRDAKEKLRLESSVIQEWQTNVMPTYEELVGSGKAFLPSPSGSSFLHFRINCHLLRLL